MPRPRFLKLDADKQAAILDAARAEFSAHGYRRSSQNRIIEAAGVSKGAMYYYFDDKADLYLTVIRRQFAGFGEVMTIGDFTTADEFWAEVEDLFTRSTAFYAQSPDTLALARSVARTVTSYGPPPGFQELLGELYGVVEKIVVRGQEVGAVRTDLPTSLIVDLAMKIGEAIDYWVAEHWTELDMNELPALNHKLTDVYRRVAAADNEAP